MGAETEASSWLPQERPSSAKQTRTGENKKIQSPLQGWVLKVSEGSSSPNLGSVNLKMTGWLIGSQLLNKHVLIWP